MTIAIVPVTPVTGSDDPAYQISVDETNNGFQKVTQSAAGLLGKSAAGDTTIITVGSGLTLSGSTLTASGGGGGYTPPDYISGGVISKGSGNTVNISACDFYDPASSSIINYAGGTNVSPGTLGTSQWNQVYLGVSGGVATPVFTNNADPPSTAYAGTARKDGSDRRWIGCFRTDGSSNVRSMNYLESAKNQLILAWHQDAGVFRMLSAGTAASFTSIALGASVPKYVAVECLFVATCDLTDTTPATVLFYLSTNGTDIDGCQFGMYVAAQNSFPSLAAWGPIDPSSPQVYYETASGASNAKSYLDVLRVRITR